MNINTLKRATVRLTLGAAAVTAFAMPGAASAQTYDVVDDFGAAVFSYGTGQVTTSPGTTTFVPVPAAQTNCFGVSITCYAVDKNSVPQIGKNVGTGTQNFATTVSVPVGTLFLHPGSGDLGTDSILQFIAPAAGLYRISALFSRLDNTTSGNGVIASVFHGTTTGLISQDFSTLINTGGAGSNGLSYNGTFGLLAGGSVYFAVNNNGEYQFDSTGLQASITSVPEVGTWAMMLLGIGVAGAGARYRRRAARVAFA